MKSSSDGRARHRNRSGVVDLVGREPLIIARVENGVKRFSPQRQKTPKFSKEKIGSGKQFSVGNFHFFGRGKILGTELHKVGQKVKKTAQSGPFTFRVIMTELPLTV